MSLGRGELIGANTRLRLPLPVRAGPPRRPQTPAQRRADRDGTQALDEGAHTVARTGPDYRCAEVDGLPGHNGHPAGGNSVMENAIWLHCAPLRHRRRRRCRVHVRSWQAAYRELLPADFLAGLQPTDWAAGYTFDAQDPLRPSPLTSDRASWGSPRCRSHLSLGRLMAVMWTPICGATGLVVSCSSRQWTASEAAGSTVAELWVLDGNERAQKFYRSHGWHRVAGHQRENVRGIEVDEVCFRRRFDARVSRSRTAPEIEAAACVSAGTLLIVERTSRPPVVAQIDCGSSLSQVLAASTLSRQPRFGADPGHRPVRSRKLACSARSRVSRKSECPTETPIMLVVNRVPSVLAFPRERPR